MRTGVVRLARALPKMLDPPLQQHSFGGHRPKLAVTCADIPVRYIDLLKQKFVTATLTLPTEGQLVTHFVCSLPAAM